MYNNMTFLMLRMGYVQTKDLSTHPKKSVKLHAATLGLSGIFTITSAILGQLRDCGDSRASLK